MPFYESVFIVRPDVSGQHVDGMAESLANIVGENGGRVTKTENWGLRSLAYRIKKNRKGHYVLLNVDAPAAAMAELERNMRIDEDVIRYLTIGVDELEEGPSVMMQSRSARDERTRRERGDRRPDAAASAPTPDHSAGKPETRVPAEAAPTDKGAEAASADRTPAETATADAPAETASADAPAATDGGKE